MNSQGATGSSDAPDLADIENPASAPRNELDSVQAAIKRCARDKGAISATTAFTFNDSSAQGRKAVSDISRIMLRPCNVEAQNCVETVKAADFHIRVQEERAHHANVRAMLEASGYTEGMRRIEERLADGQRAINDVDYRAAHIRTGVRPRDLERRRDRREHGQYLLDRCS